MRRILFTLIFLYKILFATVMRLMRGHFNHLILNNSLAFFKLRTFLNALLPTCIDRLFFVSKLNSIQWHHWSNIKVARRLAVIAMIIWILPTFHMLIFYNYYTVVNTCSSRLVFIQYLLVHFLSSI